MTSYLKQTVSSVYGTAKFLCERVGSVNEGTSTPIIPYPVVIFLVVPIVVLFVLSSSSGSSLEEFRQCDLKDQGQGILDLFGASPNGTPLSVSLRPPFAAAVAGQRYNATRNQRRPKWHKKSLISWEHRKKSFAKAAENAVAEAAKTVSGISGHE